MPRLMSPLRPRYMRKPSEEAPTEPATQAPDARLQEPPAEPEYPTEGEYTMFAILREPGGFC